MRQTLSNLITEQNKSNWLPEIDGVAYFR